MYVIQTAIYKYLLYVYCTTTTMNSASELTSLNFIEKIKSMAKRERSKIPAEKLIELICHVPDPLTDEGIPAAINELRASVDHINRIASVNKTEIATLKNEKAALKAEIDLLKVHARECKQHQRDNPPNAQPPPLQANPTNDDIKRLTKMIEEMQDEINAIQQYLRVNNLEIVGLPAPNQNETEETLLINAINELEGIESPVRHEDIDISHPLNSNRKDGKSVHVVRFVSRKTKYAILGAKKREENKMFKFRNNDVYINEHLSKVNRAIFGAAQAKKKLLKYKYCWTRGGTVYMRKTDESDVITITKEKDLDDLV